MDCIREAENYLRYYRELKQSIEHSNYMIERLVMKTAPADASAIRLEPTGIHAARPNNTLNQIYQLQKWQEMKDRTLEEIEKVDRVLDSICQDHGCERYKDILVMWYVEKLDREDIASKLGYSRRSIFYLKDKAIRKFTVSLFGFEALQAI
ncbi:rna polymerase sigma factor region 3/4 [Lucifera butyrica]|uniref:Rna polymerase sigma factor region 3/4 n=1 Tax=Lucifera butyrica TaxID=1351585 RepID=A0A498R8X2_9FIRM|nr:hypothetical protein [Lucifera butyrica]VBB05588.1 rna polymerase sigma factor region 3/4 [Lucifera butyrica]